MADLEKTLPDKEEILSNYENSQDKFIEEKIYDKSQSFLNNIKQLEAEV